ncbi:MAG: penicillin-insensitive murein endopeptidase [Myxococcales bacterium]|nr:penicillin-insensitive murein endopeptidase [Myxococcales bacterium]
MTLICSWLVALACCVAIGFSVLPNAGARPGSRRPHKHAKAKRAKAKRGRHKKQARRGKSAKKRRKSGTKRRKVAKRGRSKKHKKQATRRGKRKTKLRVARRAPKRSRHYRKRMNKRCKRKPRTKACRKWSKEKKLAAKDRARRKLARKCRKRKYRKSRQCKRLRTALRREAKARAICGVRRARARRRDTVHRMARRYKLSVSAFRSYNRLSSRSRRLRRGRRYIVYRSPFHNMKLSGGVLLERVDGVVHLQRPARGWGKPLLVNALRSAAEAVQRAYPMRSWLIMGDISKKGGGCLPPHKSHRGGLDVDIGYYYLGGKQRGWLDHASTRELDPDRTWLYLATLLRTGAVQYAFIDYGLQAPLYAAALRDGRTPEQLRSVFQYPRPKSHAKVGIIRHLQGHADHIHLRMRCLSPSCGLDETTAQRIVRAVATRRGAPVREGRRRARRPRAKTMQRTLPTY